MGADALVDGSGPRHLCTMPQANMKPSSTQPTIAGMRRRGTVSAISRHNAARIQYTIIIR
jgi:hypothetical protein